MRKAIPLLTILAVVGLLVGSAPLHAQGQAIEVVLATANGMEIPFELASNALQAEQMAEGCRKANGVSDAIITKVIVWPPKLPNPSSLHAVAWYCEAQFATLAVAKSNAQIACDYTTDVIKEVYGGWWWNRKFLGYACVKASGG